MIELWFFAVVYFQSVALGGPFYGLQECEDARRIFMIDVPDIAPHNVKPCRVVMGALRYHPNQDQLNPPKVP